MLTKTKLSNSTSVNNFKLYNTSSHSNNNNNSGNKNDDVSPYPNSNSNRTVKKVTNHIDAIEEEEHQYQPQNLLPLYNSNQNSTGNSQHMTPNTSKENSLNQDLTPKSQYSKVNTPVKHNPITEFLSSLSSSFSLSSTSSSTNNHHQTHTNNNQTSYNNINNNNNNNTTSNSTANETDVTGVKMRQNNSKAKQKQADIVQKRISLPANYISQNLTTNISNKINDNKEIELGKIYSFIIILS